MRTSNIDFEGLLPPICRSRRQLFAWFTLFWSLTAAVDPALASITLAQGQASPYWVLFSPSAPGLSELYAAAELRGYFAKATGISLPLSGEDAPSSRPVISLESSTHRRRERPDWTSPAFLTTASASSSTAPTFSCLA